MKAIEVMKEFSDIVNRLGKNKKTKENRMLRVEYILADPDSEQLWSSSEGVVKEVSCTDGFFYIEIESYEQDETGLCKNELNLNKVIKISDGDIARVDNVISIEGGVLNIELWANRLPQKEDEKKEIKKEEKESLEKLLVDEVEIIVSSLVKNMVNLEERIKHARDLVEYWERNQDEELKAKYLSMSTENLDYLEKELKKFVDFIEKIRSAKNS